MWVSTYSPNVLKINKTYCNMIKSRKIVIRVLFQFCKLLQSDIFTTNVEYKHLWWIHQIVIHILIFPNQINIIIILSLIMNKTNQPYTQKKKRKTTANTQLNILLLLTKTVPYMWLVEFKALWLFFVGLPIWVQCKNRVAWFKKFFSMTSAGWNQILAEKSIFSYHQCVAHKYNLFKV